MKLSQSLALEPKAAAHESPAIVTPPTPDAVPGDGAGIAAERTAASAESREPAPQLTVHVIGTSQFFLTVTFLRRP